MRRSAAAATALWWVGLAAVAVPARPAAESHPSVEQTREELRLVCRRLQVDNLYFGHNVIGRLESQLAQPASTTGRAVLLRLLGRELFRLGSIERAIDAFERGLAAAQEAGLPPEHELAAQLLMNLGAAHLQLAEDRNCVDRHTARSCILPIAADAVYTAPEHARTAGDVFLRRLAVAPDDPLARWLFALARSLTGDYPDAVPEAFRLPAGILDEAPGVSGPLSPWRDVAAEVGLTAFDLSGGAVIDDFDGDGLLDLISSSSHPCEPLKGYRNDGRGGFEEATREWGLDGQLGGLNLVHADYDNDGDPDLLVLRGAWLGEDGRIRNSLLRNDLDRESRRFVDVTVAAALAYPAYPTQAAAWADYDLDGDLDLYVGNESPVGTVDPAAAASWIDAGYPSQLFRNNGDGTFTDVARAAGVANLRFTKGVAWGDIDDDGDPDLYVSTFGDNRLYRNDGDGTFTDVAPELGVTDPRGSFPTWYFDYDNDGDLDLFVADYSAPAAAVAAALLGGEVEIGRPVLYRNDGGRFTDVSAAAGFTVPVLPMGANFGDLDNDGWLDLYLGTGDPSFFAILPNLMYRNRGDGTFEDVTLTAGFGHLQKGHGVAFGDLDNDGDQDLFEQLGGAFPFDAYANALFENPGNGARWITLRLEGRRANRSGVGARIEVRVRTAGGGGRSIHVMAGTGGSFGGSSLQQEIGLGDAEAIDWIEIRWPGDPVPQRLPAPPLDGIYRAVEGTPALEPLTLPSISLGRPSPPPHRSHP